MAVYREDVGYRTGVRAFFNRSVLVVFTHPCVIILICAMTPIAVRKSNLFFFGLVHYNQIGTFKKYTNIHYYVQRY